MRKIKVDKLLELPDGSKYAPVKERILALRNSEYRYSLITETTFVIPANGWFSRATLTILETGETYVGESFNAVGRGTTIQRNFPVEDASTSAVGRAFGLAGIGIDEAFASYEEMIKASEIAKTTTDTKVAEVLHDLTKVIEKSPDKAMKPIPKMRKVELDPLEQPEPVEAREGVDPVPDSPPPANESVFTEIVEEVSNSTINHCPVPMDDEDEDEGFSVSREELVAEDSPLLTGDWKTKHEIKREIRRINRTTPQVKKAPPRSPQTVDEITGKGITQHMKDVFVECMKKGVNPFDYPERNTDKKFTEILNAVNRGEESFREFVIREWGEKFANVHKANGVPPEAEVPREVTEENDLADIVSEQEIAQQREKEQPKRQPLMLDNGKTIAETIAHMNNPYGELPINPNIKRKAEREIAKQESELVVPEMPVNTGGMQPNKDFDKQGKGGTLKENLANNGNKFGVPIAPLAERQVASKFMKFATLLVNKGVDIELFETYFERHHLSSEFPSFEALLREGSEAQINEFLNNH